MFLAYLSIYRWLDLFIRNEQLINDTIVLSIPSRFLQISSRDYIFLVRINKEEKARKMDERGATIWRKIYAYESVFFFSNIS